MQPNFMLARPLPQNFGQIVMDTPPFWSWAPAFQEAR
jgi:hypothetical protein